MVYTAVILGAGTGTRMNLGYNKMLYQIEEGKTILEKTISVFENDEKCTQIVLVMNPDDMAGFRDKVTWNGHFLMIAGGATRQESVFMGLTGTSEETVLIHDGARCFIKQEQIDDLLNAMEENDAALLMVPCKDTIKEVVDGKVVKTLDRSVLYQAQTPQAFKTDLIVECAKKAREEGYTGTDDASLVERYSDTKVAVVLSDYSNLKVTTMEDVR